MPLLHAEAGEWAVRSADFSEQLGTVVSRMTRFEFGSGSDDDVAEVIDYYRDALPKAGWSIDVEEELAADRDRGREFPVTRLLVSGDGYDEVTVTAQQRNAVVLVTVSVMDILAERSPYGAHPPLIALPDWFLALPELPDDAVREKITITDRLDEPTTARIEFYFGDSLDADGPELLDMLAGHYRAALPANGWTVTDEERDSESEELAAGTSHTERMAWEFHADGASGGLAASHTSYSFDDAPRSVSAAVTVSRDG